MENVSLMFFGTQGKRSHCFHERIRLTTIVVPVIGKIVFVANIILERQFVMLKYDRMNTMTKIANLNQLSI